MNTETAPENSPTPPESTQETTQTQETTAPAATTEPAAAEPAKPEASKAEPLAATDITIPEGYEVAEDGLNGFLEVANQHGISRDAANALIGLYTSELERMSGASSTEFQSMKEQWKQEALALPDMAEGKREATLASIGKLLNQYGSDELRTALDLTGAGEHPAVTQFFINVAKALGEGGMVTGKPGNQPVSRADALFGNMFSSKG